MYDGVRTKTPRADEMYVLRFITTHFHKNNLNAKEEIQIDRNLFERVKIATN